MLTVGYNETFSKLLPDLYSVFKAQHSLGCYLTHSKSRTRDSLENRIFTYNLNPIAKFKAFSTDY